MFTILVVGAGYVGSEIAMRFASEKQKVYALTRTRSRRHDDMHRSGVVPMVADITDGEQLKHILPPAHFVVFCPAPEEHSPEAYESLYLRGLKNVTDILRGGPKPRLFVYLSSTKVWGARVDGWVDESVPPAPDGREGEILAASERQALGSGLPAVVLRLSGIYGPGRNRIASVKNGDWPAETHQGTPDAHGSPEPTSEGPMPRPDRYMNMIHRDDIAGAMRIFFNRAKIGQIYLGVDSEPTPASEVCRWLCQKLKVPSPAVEWKSPPTGKRCRNSKLKDLGVILRYPSFRVGYDQLVDHYFSGLEKA